MSTPYIEQPDEAQLSQERADLLDTLGKHRMLLRVTVRDLTDEQAGLRSTVSELCLGGLHQARRLDRGDLGRLHRAGPGRVRGRPRLQQAGGGLPDAARRHAGEHPAALRAGGRPHRRLVRSLPSLDHAQPLPPAPWFPPNATWSARRVFIHIVAETAQHAGHADILREAIDGAKSMG